IIAQSTSRHCAHFRPLYRLCGVNQEAGHKRRSLGQLMARDAEPLGCPADRRAKLLKSVVDQFAGWGGFFISTAFVHPFSSSIGLRKTPIPSISISQTSPCRIQAGGLRAWATPEGVPVSKRSPGSSVMPWVA